MPSAASHPDIPPFPSPSTFSILPDIYLLIARLNILQQQPSSSSSTSTTKSTSNLPAVPLLSQSQPESQSQTQVGSQTQTQGQSQPESHTQSQSQSQVQIQTPTQTQSTQQIQTQASTLPGAGSGSSSGSGSGPLSQVAPLLQTGPPLDLKDLPAQVYPIKQNIAKARAAVTALPDIERSVEEQEDEIRELEKTVALLKNRLRALGAIATANANDGPKQVVRTDGEDDAKRERMSESEGEGEGEGEGERSRELDETGDEGLKHEDGKQEKSPDGADTVMHGVQVEGEG